MSDHESNSEGSDTEDQPVLNNEETTYVDSSRSRKKRAIIGILIGSILLIGLIILIIVLMTTGSSPSPTPKNEFENPFTVSSNETPPLNWTYNLHNRRYKAKSKEKDNSETLGLEDLSVFLVAHDDHMLHIKIIDKEHLRWEAPNLSPSEDHSQWIQIFQHYDLETLGLEVNFEPFSFSFTAKDSDVPIFSTMDLPFEFKNKDILFNYQLQTPYIYGMGERLTHEFLLQPGNYTLFNSKEKAEDPWDYGKLKEPRALYGTHPFYLNRLLNNKFMGVYMNNINAQEFSFWPIQEGDLTTHVSHRMIGGVVDLYLFHSADPEYIVRKYHSVIGRPNLPPLV